MVSKYACACVRACVRACVCFAFLATAHCIALPQTLLLVLFYLSTPLLHRLQEAYPPLCDIKGSYTAQFEHTLVLKCVRV